jgi:tRNA modification GTPase
LPSISFMTFTSQDTIVALSTPSGSGAIAIVRLTGSNTLAILNQIFFTKKNSATWQTGKTYFGEIKNLESVCIDEVIVSIYLNPRSYTGEDLVEICCHASSFIINQIIGLCIANNARLATAGEFTQRAFLNGKLDLSQAESVADLIASENKAQHQMAMNQMRGGFSSELNKMRNELIHFAALLELELDFSEEDVEFADRTAFETLLKNIEEKVTQLKNSFAFGNAIKKGIPVAIVGKPNSGKSTLLNTLLNEEKAIVSDIAGTTRDVIEDTIQINGAVFRLIDTAGLRETIDTIEKLGIEKTMQKTKEATIVLLIADVQDGVKNIIQQYTELQLHEQQQGIIVVNKIDEGRECDAYDMEEAIATISKKATIAISAKHKIHIDKLAALITKTHLQQYANNGDVVINNIRHFEALENILINICRIQTGMQQNVSGELIAIDVRTCLRYIGAITGEIEVDRDILGTIFGKFCIGK